MAKKTKEPDVFTPSKSLLIKLASIAGHADELISPNGHQFDKSAIEGLLVDHEVVPFLQQMRKMGFMPLKRN